ncbi:MAG TPA: molybdopterin molybdenumtransferase MoeA [Thermopetrobacter sp.]|nr:molybdopterin molybdenumtransferase MoeA [Thermopetrobacter sp.]
MSSTPRRLANDCFAALDTLMPHEEAMRLLKERITPVVDTEEVALAEALGRVLAEDVIAPRDIPAFANAAMDGVAVRHADLDAGGETVLPLVMTVFAGDVPGPLPRGAAARIFTGAPMPEGADTCIMQEDVVFEDDAVRIPPGAKKGINVRPAGEDQRAGKAVVAAGANLRAPELAAVASAGQAEVTVFRPLKVALISSGNEIVRPGTPWNPGRIYDANHYILRGAMAGLPVEVIDMGIVADTREAVAATLEKAAARADVIVTSAGVSRGEADHMAETVARMGSLHAWRLAIKPGKPIAFGQIGDTVVLGLPGNPVAAFVTFLVYGWPVLSRLAGHAWREPERYVLPAGFRMARRKTGRREFLRGWTERDAAGRTVVRRFPRDGSGLISSAVAATGLIEITEETAAVEEGDAVAFIPFGAFGLGPK